MIELAYFEILYTSTAIMKYCNIVTFVLYTGIGIMSLQ